MQPYHFVFIHFCLLNCLAAVIVDHLQAAVPAGTSVRFPVPFFAFYGLINIPQHPLRIQPVPV